MFAASCAVPILDNAPGRLLHAALVHTRVRAQAGHARLLQPHPPPVHNWALRPTNTDLMCSATSRPLAKTDKTPSHLLSAS